jgi:hypothetical protein
MADKTTEQRLQELLDREEAREAEAKKAADAAARAEAEANFVSKADLQVALDAFGAQIAKQIGEEVAKATPIARPEGAGRVGEVVEVDERDENPVAYLVKKSRTEEGLSDEDKKLAWELTRRAIMQGMAD